MISNRIGFRVKPKDEKLLKLLAQRLDRTTSDTVRFAIYEVARQYGLLPPHKDGKHLKKKKEDLSSLRGV